MTAIEAYKAERLARYFRSAPSPWPGILVGCFAITLLSMESKLGYVFLAFAAILVSPSIFHMSNRATDQQVDHWTEEDLTRLTSERAEILDNLGLLEDQLEREPLTTHGPLVRNTSFAAPKLQRGDDGLVRCSVHELMVLGVSEHHLHVHRCVFDTIQRKVTHLGAREYAHRDIVSVHGTREVRRSGAGDLAAVVASATAGKGSFWLSWLGDQVPDGNSLPVRTATLTYVNGDIVEIPVHVPGTPGDDEPATELDQLLELLRMLYRAAKQEQLGQSTPRQGV